MVILRGGCTSYAPLTSRRTDAALLPFIIYLKEQHLLTDTGSRKGKSDTQRGKKGSRRGKVPQPDRRFWPDEKSTPEDAIALCRQRGASPLFFILLVATEQAGAVVVWIATFLIRPH